MKTESYTSYTAQRPDRRQFGQDRPGSRYRKQGRRFSLDSFPAYSKGRPRLHGELPRFAVISSPAKSLFFPIRHQSAMGDFRKTWWKKPTFQSIGTGFDAGGGSDPLHS
jgi:hypothetical protein